MNQIIFTDEEMLQSLKDFYKENNRVPYMKDFKGKKPSESMIAKRFGTWNNAIKLAGLHQDQKDNRCYSKEYLIECLLEYHEKFNKVPTTRDFRSKGYPTIHAYINHFGSFKNALIEVGLFELRKDKHQFCDEYTDDELLDYLKNFIKNKKGRIPSSVEFKTELTNPSASTYDRRFGGILNAVKMIGYDIDKQREIDDKLLKEDMARKYKELANKLGRTPNSRDIETECRSTKNIYSMSAYEFHFGNLYNLQVLCELTPTVIGRNKSRKDLIDDLIKLSNILGRTPSQNDLIYFDDIASQSKYLREFGSWNDAIKESGLKPNNDVYYSNKGEKCLSYYELVFTNMLEEYNIKFTKENMYKEFMQTKRKYRFDFVIEINNNKLFIEIFGIVCRKDYQERIKNKIKLCKENNIPLIEIYPKDFTNYKLELIHEMLMTKIKELSLQK